MRLRHAVPALLAGLPPGDGRVPPDHLDRSQPAAGTAHGLLGLDHRRADGRLRDLALSAGLFSEHEVGRAVTPASIVLILHGL
jgi:hypothetical protein